MAYHARADSAERGAPPTVPGSDSILDWSSAAGNPDDLSREVYCILGMPIDAVEMPAVMQSIAMAAANSVPESLDILS